jgi:hypothetical protein
MGAYAYDLSATGARFKGLMAEVHFIDGTAYDASYFGETRDGVWVPKEVTGLTYGSNGFYLDFAGNDTGVTLLLDGSGGGTATITDNSSAGNDMTNVSSGVSNLNTAGPYNGALQDVLDFDGTSGDYLTIPYNSSFSFGSDNFTIEMWMKRASQNTRTWLMGQCDSGANDYTWIEINDDNTIEFQDVNIGAFASTGTITNDGNWHHVALVRNGSTFTWFIDGTSSGTTTSTSSLNNNTTNNFSIGRLGEYSGGNNYNGQLADIRITRPIARDIAAEWTNGVYTSALTNTPEYLGDSGVDRTTNSNDFSVEGNITPDDQLLDTPNLRFATWDTVNSGSTAQFREGNLLIDHGTTDTAISTMGSSAKFYAEMYYKSGTYFMAEVRTAIGSSTYAGYWSVNGNAYNTNTAYGDSFGTGSIIGVAVDANTGTVWFSKNGVWQNGATASGIAAGTDTNYARTGLTGTLYLASSDGTGSDVGTEIIANFGQDHTFAGQKPALLTPYSDANGVGEFYYQPPSGFLALADNYVDTDSLATTGVLSVSEMLQASL